MAMMLNGLHHTFELVQLARLSTGKQMLRTSRAPVDISSDVAQCQRVVHILHSHPECNQKPTLSCRGSNRHAVTPNGTCRANTQAAAQLSSQFYLYRSTSSFSKFSTLVTRTLFRSGEDCGDGRSSFSSWPGFGSSEGSG